MQVKTTLRLALLCVVVGAVTVQAGPAEDAAKAFADGQALLGAVKFTEALQAFGTAAKADAGNQTYQQTYAMLRQVMLLREKLAQTQDSVEWLAMAQPLRTFYHDHGIYAESLPLDLKIHQDHLVPNSAAMLAETLLAMGRNSEAAEMLGGLDEQQATPRTAILLGLSLARQGRIDEAKAAAGEAQIKEDAGPSVFYELACVRALTSEPMAAIEALTRSFELTPPSRLDALKAKAQECPDLVALAGTADLAEALKAQSKITESKCSKGTSCGKCPHRAKCSGGAEHDKGK